MKILITGFDPFNGEKINPSYEAVKRVKDSILGANILKLELPTEFKKSKEVLREFIEKNRPDIVISVGQAGSRASISVEEVAINLEEASIEDNSGYKPIKKEVIYGGENAYFSNLPTRAIVNYLRENEIPSELSYTAGTYVCNSIMYTLLHLCSTKYKAMKAGFVHVPYISNQVLDRPKTPHMSLVDIVKSLELIIEAIVKDKKYEKKSMGSIM